MPLGKVVKEFLGEHPENKKEVSVRLGKFGIDGTNWYY